MLRIEKTVTPSPTQMQMIIEGMRNPMNSWDRMDSDLVHIEDPDKLETADYTFQIGDNDEKLMHKLAAGGAVHAKYRRMMTVIVTLSAPLYWWKEFDTYKVGTVANSCSTMHKIAEKPFTMEDFSVEHLTDHSVSMLELILDVINMYRNMYLESRSVNALEEVSYNKTCWWQMIQLLPSSYNQKRTVMLNYEVLDRIFRDRHEHKLDEWHTFCDWIETLPYIDIVCPYIQLIKEGNACAKPQG